MIPAAHHDSSPNLSFTSPRTAQIASFIATQLFYVDEQALRSDAWGKTRFEQDTSKTHWIHALKGFIPFWGSLEDLQSDSPEKRALGVLGLFLDIVSFAIPWASLSPAASVLQPWQENGDSRRTATHGAIVEEPAGFELEKPQSAGRCACLAQARRPRRDRRSAGRGASGTPRRHAPEKAGRQKR
jgi:hypothetical protein